MFAWNNKYEWTFSKAGHSISDQGPEITGTGMFRGSLYKNVAREILQNSTDAKDPKLPDSIPVKVEFEMMYLDADDIPGVKRLSEVLDLCCDFIENEHSNIKEKVAGFRAGNENYLKKGKVPALRISDYKTVGLDKENFEGLLLTEGITPKKGDTGGSFGYGKFAPFLLTQINTIIYVSRTVENEYLLQGKALLSTFREKDGVKKQGSTLFGLEENDEFYPIKEIEDVPPVFRRKEAGTDLYVLCFEKENDWMEQMAISVIENFFYAIHIGLVEIVIKDKGKTIHITKGNLEKRIREFEEYYNENIEDESNEFEFTAPLYWNVLTDPRTIKNPNDSFKDFRGKGSVDLFVLMGEDIEGRRVLEMRKSGMKILEDKKFERLPAFNAVLIATAEGREDEGLERNISKFLREMEGPAHNSWMIEDLPKNRDDLKKEGTRVIRDLHNGIRAAVKSQIPEEGNDPVDAFGLSQIAPDLSSEGEEKIPEEAFSSFVPLEESAQKTKDEKRRKRLTKKVNGRGKNTNPDPPPKPEPDPNKPKKKRNNKQGKKLTSFQIENVKSPYNEEKNYYRISFVPKESTDNLRVQIQIAGDDTSLFDLPSYVARMDGRVLNRSEGFIVIPKVTIDERVRFDVEIDDERKLALEVTAYAKR